MGVRGRFVLAAMASASLVAAVLAPSAHAEPDSAPPREETRALPAQATPRPSVDPRYDVVFGLIVRKAKPEVSTRGLATAAEAAGADVAETARLTSDISVLTFAEPLTREEAAPLQAAMAARPDVLGVEPDRIVFPAADPAAAPDFPNDPRFDEQWDMWDGGGTDDFSVRGPLIWGETKGSPSVVVGVIDTGSTNHPDLAGTTVPGFDFISDVPTARDGNEWDSDPADEGDWCPAEGTDSSWHGTHVHGTINAVQDNGIGITGLAPAVKVQHLRALGACGGLSSDTLAAVIWGSGGSLAEWFDPFPGQNPGANPTPAEVLNMSLGGEGECDASVSQAIFDEARARGTTVVVAAGNESSPAGGFWPGNCQRVVNVAATNRSGDLAGFSNYGTRAGRVTLAAPGVGILSTMNQGVTIPAGSGYVNYDGTSMATPHVAAAAALLYSLGVTSPSAVVNALKAAVHPFPAGSSCTALERGAGTARGARRHGRRQRGDDRARAGPAAGVGAGGRGR
ncbi:MAG: S8 family serine peptidase, partial [bacterium]